MDAIGSPTIDTNDDTDKAIDDHQDASDNIKNESVNESKTTDVEQGTFSNKAFDDDNTNGVDGVGKPQQQPPPSTGAVQLLDHLVQITKMDTNRRIRMSSYSSKDSFKRR